MLAMHATLDPSQSTAKTRTSTDFLADNYLASLLSYSLDSLSKEPSLLKSQEEALRQELQETATKNYKGFIEAASCFNQINTQVQHVKTQLHAFTETLQSLQLQTNAFAVAAADYQERHARNRSLLAQHMPLLDLLELPQLIDTCIRNGNHDEALDLITYANKLSLAAPDTPVVSRLAAEVAECRAGLLQQLLGRLCRSVTLPECLRTVSYLRRLAVFTEGDLRLRFLQCREQWFQSVVAALDESNTADYLRQLTDCNRVHLFDVVMQFRAIFAADAASATRGEAVAATASPSQASRVLFSWAHHRVQAYVDTMDSLLPTIQDGGTLTALLEACNYCGRSLARAGLDFRALLAPAISTTAHTLFHSHMALAAAMFASATETHKWVLMPVAKRDSSDVAAGDAHGLLASALGLMEHPPLAVLVNGVIAALNAVRAVALPSLSAAAAQEVQEVVGGSAALLAHVPAARHLSSAEVAVHQEACRAMADTLCPLLLHLFKQVFTESAQALPDLTDAAALLQACTSTSTSTASASSAPRRPQTPPTTQAAPSSRFRAIPPSTSPLAAHPPRSVQSPSLHAHRTETHASLSPTQYSSPPARSIVSPPGVSSPVAKATSAAAALSPVVSMSSPQSSKQSASAGSMAKGGSPVKVEAPRGFGGFGGDDDDDGSDSYEEDAW